jgi:sucrose phosphorylase
LLDGEEIAELVAITEARGGRHGTYDSAEGPRPYELNIALWDLLTGTSERPDDGLTLERFVCAHAIMIGVEGVPAVYINSLFAEPNDRATADQTGVRRDIGRARLEATTAHRLLDGDGSDRSRAAAELLRLLEIRGRQPAFHPNATQFTLQLGDALFAFWRQSTDRTQSIFAIHNCTDDVQDLPLAQLNLIATDAWRDLVSGRAVGDVGETWTMAPYETIWLTNRTEST